MPAPRQHKRPRGTILGVAVALGLAATAACGGGATAEDESRGTAAFEQLSPSDAPALYDVVATSNTTGFRLMELADPVANAVVSPASFTFAFAMLAPGASGDAVDEMTQMLGAPPADAVDAVNALMGVLAEWEGDVTAFDPEEIPETPFVHVANRVTIDDQFAVEEAYLDVLSQRFDAGLGSADLSSPAAKDLFDEWVQRHTAGLIEESALEPSEDLVLALQNAVLFAARWLDPFEEDATLPREFTPLDGAPFETEMMSGLKQNAAYAESGGWTAIALPYTEGFTAVFALPPEGADPMAQGHAAVASAVDSLKEQLAGVQRGSVQVTLPIVDTKSKLELLPALEAMGFSAILTGSARPFDGIAPVELEIGQAAQQAVLKVNEEGTVAAAVTEIGMDATSAPVVDHEFLADRPYLMVITEDSTGWDLFQAAIRDPRQ
ncbi:MAG TPA: serpin family protein [Actinomycetaceae bacterium]|nr:serpin family protein [Actinomycetaceae bacterium]